MTFMRNFPNKNKNKPTLLILTMRALYQSPGPNFAAQHIFGRAASNTVFELCN